MRGQRWQAVLAVLVVALAMRWLYASWAVADFWGDAYHHWLISRLTLSHDWRYTDYKGLETVWLPGYHYLVSAVMILSGRFDLAPAHVTNIVLGTAASGLTAWLTIDFTGKLLAGLLAGLALALTPWHIAYSVINMPEVLAGLLLLFLLLAAHQGWVVGLGVLALIGALTRHELTLALIVIALWLVWQRRLKPALALGLGATLGVGGWAAWSWWKTADPLQWWTRYQALALWDARFWRAASSPLDDLGALGNSAIQAWPLLPWLGIITLVSLRRHRPSAITVLLVALAGAHAFFLALGFVVGHLPVANPRYALGILPVWVILLVKSLAWRRELIAVMALVVAWALWAQLPELRGAAYIIRPERAAGEFLAGVESSGGNLWVDAPATIYYSGLAPDRFLSSEQLVPHAERDRPDLSRRVLDRLVARDVEYILWEDVSYTYVEQVWPELAGLEPFEVETYRFEPIFHYDGWETEFGARPTTVWQISRGSK